MDHINKSFSINRKHYILDSCVFKSAVISLLEDTDITTKE